MNSKSMTNTRTVRVTTSVALALFASACARDATVETTRLALTTPVTVTFQDGLNGYFGTTDTHLLQNSTSSNYGATTTLMLDGDEPNGTTNDASPLIRWDVSGIPMGSTVTSAVITLQIPNASGQAYPFYAVRRAWLEASATWQVASVGAAWQTPGAMGANDRDPVSIGSLPASATGTRTVTLNATGIAKIQEWVSDPSKNFGIIGASASNNDGVNFLSSETATVAQRPKLTVIYSPPSTPDAAVDAPTDVPGTGGSATGGAGTGGNGMGGNGTGGSETGGAGTGGSGTGGSETGGGTGGSETGGSGTGGSETGGSGTGGSETGGAGGVAVDAGATSGDAGGAGGAPGAGTGGAGTGGTQGPPAFLYAAGDIGYSTTTTDTATGLLLDGSSDPIAVLGDIAYQNGSSRDFTRNFVPPWGRHKARMKPTPGNHEYQTANATGYFGYFGAAAGSSSTGYYSYNLGAWHIVALNTGKCSSSPSTCISAAQVQWLRDDLIANPRACTLAYWHHPRFSAGEHGADAATNSVAVLWDVLMEFGADVILNGHDHNYERFAPQNTAGGAVANGIAQFVVGSGGAPMRALAFTPSSNSVTNNTTDHGVLKLTLRDTSYDWRFIPITGKTYADAGSANCH